MGVKHVCGNYLEVFYYNLLKDRKDILYQFIQKMLVIVALGAAKLRMM